MDTLSLALVLLLAVVLSDLLSRVLASALPFSIPKPLIQVAFGAVMGLFPALVVTLDPEVFFLLLLAPGAQPGPPSSPLKPWSASARPATPPSTARCAWPRCAPTGQPHCPQAGA